MVCKIDDEEQATCVVRDFSGTSQDLKIEMMVSANMTGKHFVREVASRFNFESDSFKLVSPSICKKNGFQAVITEKSEDTLKDIGINFENGSRNLFIVEGLDGNSKPIIKSDDLELGASASPEEPSSSNSCSPPLSEMSGKQSISRRFRLALQDQDYSSQSKSSDSPYFTGYRGLVNQAMTCYLNSLLQTLFMTPEFRNALYNWKYTPAPGTDESKSSPISFELQKLFLNLQTSPRESVETTELTRSFGWHNNEAWQQHDIQELCRLMFDELENEFKGTEQADLINELYQGKMIDYVKCLDCGTEKNREDTFLDIPLPVRPFGRATAYGSVEEALRAFVQPEVLEGNNQYFCEKCNKKCDAHKGLKFLKFPYLLTLHLMRFDFDYNTMHRIKLSDKVVFPETLNLNSFVPFSNVSGSSIYKDEGSEGFPEEITGSSSKCDDSSTTDSGSAIDDENCMASSSDNVDYEQDVDEGIDVGNQLENEKNRNHNLESGPYVYELFSIMVHSGSASGGHYYAYIKDLCTGDWYCFNDQDVRRINSEQIENSFGGYAPTRGYYSGVYSSSMNAYMLMYRQIDKDRNMMPWKEHQFPPHIKALLKEMNEQAEYNKRLKEKERKMCKIKIFVHHPAVNSRRDSKIDCETREPLKEVIQKAHKKLQLEGTVPLELCRLVLYNSQEDSIEGSLEGRENDEIGSIILCDIKKCEMMLEIRSEDTIFQTYKLRSVPVQLLRVRLENNQLDQIVTRRTSLYNTLAEFKNELYSYFDVDQSEKLFVMLETKGKTERFLDDEKQQLETCGVTNNSRIFVCFKVTDSINKTRLHMRTQVKRYLNMLRLKILLPEVKSDTFQRWSEYASIDNQKCSEETRLNEKDSASQVNESAMEITCNGCGGGNRRPMMVVLPPALLNTSLLTTDETYSNEITSQTSNVAVLNINVGGHHSDQSASEDSSLTDSDRTIIGETQEDYQVSSSGSSPRGGDIRDRSTNDLVSEEENYYDTWNRTSGDYENVNDAFNENPSDYYFKEVSNGGILEKKTELKVEVDKRIPMLTFKKHLEPYVQGSSLFFNIWSNDKMLSTLECVENNATLKVKLSRPPPKANMLKVKLFLLDYRANKMVTDLDDFYIDESSTVGDTKKDLIQFLLDCHDIRIDLDRCRLRIAPNGPGRVCLNEEVWKNLRLMNDWELYVQHLDGAEFITDPENEINVVIRRYSAKISYSRRLVHEVVLKDLSMDGLKAQVAEVSGIPEENLAFAVLTWQTVLNMNSFRMSYVSDTSLEWNTIANSKRLDDWLNNFKANNYLICYRDSREEPTDRNCASEKPLKINSNKKRQS